MSDLTVAQARRVVALDDCKTFGHSWNVVESVGAGPIAVVCTRCGESRKVEPKQ